MSDNSQAQERTEQPTPKRRQKAREKGQVPRSRELNTMSVMIAGAACFVLFGGWMFSRLSQLLTAGLSSAGHIEGGALMTVRALEQSMTSALFLLSPFLLTLTIAAFAGPVLVGGAMFSADGFRPKLERLSPMKGIKRIFSTQGLMELFKTLLKFAVLSSGAMLLLWWLADDLVSLGNGSPSQRIIDAGGVIQTGFLLLSLGLVLIAAVDLPFQLWSHTKQLRMTRQEIKDELKESEGSPETRGRVRRLQQEVAQRRMMADIPLADVVIMNPTHFAVALRYSDRPDGAPRVVAKGRDLVALRIRDVAAEHEVAVCTAPPLARAIYQTTQIGQEIPAALYLAVARVLVWVMQLKTARSSGAPVPEAPEDLPVPEELATTERNEA